MANLLIVIPDAYSVSNSSVLSTVLTGYVSGAGTVASTDTILQAIDKLNGNNLLKAPINSPTFTGSPASVTNTNILDASTAIATDAFVQTAINASMSTLPLNVNGISGQLSFASLGTNCLLNVGVTAGVITSIAVAFSQGGSGYKVGDIIQPSGGNHDAMIYVATVSGTAAATLSILYGGTGYSNGTAGSAEASSSFWYTLLLTGAIAGNIDILVRNGTYLSASNQWIMCNDTTNAHLITVHLSNGSDAPTGNGVILPQGTDCSASIQVQTDGVSDVWFAGLLFPIMVDYTASTGSPFASTTHGAGIFDIIVDANLTINGPAVAADGQKITFALYNDASHSCTFASGSSNFSFGATIPSYTATPSKTDYVEAIYNGITSTWNIVAVSLGF